MRIAHFGMGRCRPDSANGVDQALYHLSAAQAALGHAVALFQLTSKEPVPVPGVEVRSYAPRALPFALPEGLAAELADWRPDVVHLHSVFVPANAALARWLRRRRIAYVVTPHSSLSPAALRRRRLAKLVYRRLFELPTLNAAAFVHALAQPNGFGRFGVRAPVVVAPNGVDLTALPAAPRAALLSSRFPAARGRRVLLFLGRLDPGHKGLDLLLRGLALARPGGVALVLVGPDHRGGRRSLEALARRLGIAEQVFFAGPEYGVAKYDLIAGADVLVQCSRSEGMPLAVLEAAASRRPCLVTAAASLGGSIARCEAGVEVEASPESIAEALSRLAGIPEPELRRMGENGRRMVEREFTWARTAGILTEAYETHARSRD